MVPQISSLSLALCHEVLEGGGNHKMKTSIAKRDFPSCSLRLQFTASQKLPLLFPNAPLVTTNGLYLDDLQANHLNPTRSQHTKPVTGNQHRKKKLPLLLTSFAIHCLTKASAFVPQCGLVAPSN